MSVIAETNIAPPAVTVIVPTHNRKDSLLRALDSLSRQTYPCDRFEVIIVDDGSNDGTQDAVNSLSLPYRLKYLFQLHLGVGSARQYGLEAAAGKICLYLDDDMVAEPEVIAEHIAVHESHEHAVVKGQVILALEDAHSVFAARHSGASDLPVRGDGKPQPISYQQVFAGHFSIARQDAMAAGGWHPEARGYGFRDLDFMHHCRLAGLTMWFAPGAITYHHDHATTLSESCRRMERASYSAATHLFVQHTELKSEMAMYYDKGPIVLGQDPLALIARKLVRQVASSRLVMAILEEGVPLLERLAPASRPLMILYRWITSGYIYRGYRAGLKDLARRSPRKGERLT